MKIKDYLKMKGRKHIGAETARLLGLEWPLQAGWGKQLMPSITPEFELKFLKSLEVPKKGSKKKKGYTPYGQKDASPNPDLSNRFPTNTEWKEIAARAKKDANDRFFKSEEWRTVRYKVITLHNGQCAACGRSKKEHGCVMHVDHIIPRSWQPELALEISNLQLLCEDCNLGKGNRDSTDWRPKRG